MFTKDFTRLAQAVCDNTIPEGYQRKSDNNQKQPEKSFKGNVKAILENGVKWYSKRFPKHDCCNLDNTITDCGFMFCKDCGSLELHFKLFNQ